MKTLLSPHEQRMHKLNSTWGKTSSLSPRNEMWDKRKDMKCKLQMGKKINWSGLGGQEHLNPLLE